MTQCVVPFLTYSASKNGVTLKLRVEVVQGHWKWRSSIDHIRLIICASLYIALYLIPFMSYLTLKNIVTLKSASNVGPYELFWQPAFVCYSSILYLCLLIGQIKMLACLLKIWSLKVIQTGTIQKLGCGFLFACHSNYGRIFCRLSDIQCQSCE